MGDSLSMHVPVPERPIVELNVAYLGVRLMAGTSWLRSPALPPDRNACSTSCPAAAHKLVRKAEWSRSRGAKSRDRGTRSCSGYPSSAHLDREHGDTMRRGSLVALRQPPGFPSMAIPGEAQSTYPTNRFV